MAKKKTYVYSNSKARLLAIAEAISNSRCDIYVTVDDSKQPQDDVPTIYTNW